MERGNLFWTVRGAARHLQIGLSMAIHAPTAPLGVEPTPLRRLVERLHEQDATAAREELRAALAEVGGGFAGAILLSCLGRGEGLYGCPNHDSDQVRARCGDIPVAGFFAEGEVGPVGGETFVHGYTSVIGLFRSRDSETASVEVTEGS